MLQPLSSRFTIRATVLPSDESPAMEHDGNQYAFQYNTHGRDVRIVNPNDGMLMGHPTENTLYPLLTSITNGHKTYFKDAMVTTGYTACDRLHHDVSIMVKLNDTAITALNVSGKQAPADQPNGEAEIISLFRTPEA